MAKFRPIPVLIPDEIARFWAKVDKTSDPGGCWLWTAALSGVGYGVIGFGPRGSNQIFLAHRVAYAIVIGSIPDGMTLDHVWDRGCRNRHCVNPAHLEPVTQLQNVRRYISASHVPKTHCPLGHQLFGENLYETKSREGWIKRECRICRRENTRAFRERRKAVA